MQRTIVEQIRSEIRSNGPISFARFMELALYSPGMGYYEVGSDAIGRRGDFYTSVSVGSVFGELLAFQFAEWLEPLMKTEDGRCAIVEAGAHNGQLALDILSWLKRYRPAVWDRIEYWILEPSPIRQSWQAGRLSEFSGRVRWCTDWDETPHKVEGIIFANELLDAFPVHRFGWEASASRWFEWGVGWKGDRFDWVRLTECTARPPQFSTELQKVLRDGYILESAPGARFWWETAAKCLRAGRLLAFDYGFSKDELFRPERTGGTLRAYHDHGVESDVLADPGQQDLTAHVDFDSIERAGERMGLRTELFTTQAKFLVGVFERAMRCGAVDHWATAQRRQFQTLVHPEHLGRAFRVLVQLKVSMHWTHV